MPSSGLGHWWSDFYTSMGGGGGGGLKEKKLFLHDPLLGMLKKTFLLPTNVKEGGQTNFYTRSFHRKSKSKTFLFTLPLE